jgi:hypothetical protein
MSTVTLYLPRTGLPFGVVDAFWPAATRLRIYRKYARRRLGHLVRSDELTALA